MHIADIELGMLGCNGIVGAGLPIGVRLGAQRADPRQRAGHGRLLRRRRRQPGPRSRGDQPRRRVAAAGRLRVREQPGCAVHRVARGARRREHRGARRRLRHAGRDGRRQRRRRHAPASPRPRSSARADGGGPTLIEAATYRRTQHSVRTNLRELRDPGDGRGVDAPRPVLHVESALAERGVRAAALQAARAAVDADLEDAIGWAQAEQVLDEGDLAAFVYARQRARLPGARGERADARLLRRRQRGAPAQRWRPTRASSSWARTSAGSAASSAPPRACGSSSAAARVRNTPISEGGFTGLAVGAALSGLRPVVELQIFDFVTLADGRDRQPGGEVTLHDRRSRARPDRRARAVRRRHPSRGAALAEPGGLVRARPGPDGRRAVLAGRRQGSARGRDPRRQPGDLPRGEVAAVRRESGA